MESTLPADAGWNAALVLFRTFLVTNSGLTREMRTGRPETAPSPLRTGEKIWQSADLLFRSAEIQANDVN